MEIHIFDKAFNKFAIIDSYSSLIWCKRYYDVGALDLQIEATTETLSIFKKDFYIMRDDEKTIYQIKAIELDTAENRDNHLLVGAVECKNILSQRIIWNTISFNGTVENYIRKLITDNIISPTLAERKISNFALKSAKGFSELITQQVSYDNLQEKIIELCKTYNFGWEVTFENGIFYFDLYRGVDRSINQSENIPLIFSPEYDNLISTKYEMDATEFKNVALVGGEGEGKDRKLASVGSAAGLDRYEIFVDNKSDSTNTEVEISETEYINQLRSTGSEELAKNATTTKFEGEVVSDSYVYKKDFNLGDIVTIKNEYGITVDARIVEVIETWDDDGYSFEPKFEYMDVPEFEIAEASLLTENAEPIVTENEVALLAETSTSTTGIKISQLPEVITVNDSDIIPIVQSGYTKNVKVETLLNNSIGNGHIFYAYFTAEQISNIEWLSNFLSKYPLGSIIIFTVGWDSYVDNFQGSSGYFTIHGSSAYAIGFSREYFQPNYTRSIIWWDEFNPNKSSGWNTI